MIIVGIYALFKGHDLAPLSTLKHQELGQLRCFHCPSAQTGSCKTVWFCVQCSYLHHFGTMVMVHPATTTHNTHHGSVGLNHHPCLASHISYMKGKTWGSGKPFGKALKGGI